MQILSKGLKKENIHVLLWIFSNQIEKGNNTEKKKKEITQKNKKKRGNNREEFLKKGNFETPKHIRK